MGTVQRYTCIKVLMRCLLVMLSVPLWAQGPQVRAQISGVQLGSAGGAFSFSVVQGNQCIAAITTCQIANNVTAGNYLIGGVTGAAGTPVITEDKGDTVTMYAISTNGSSGNTARLYCIPITAGAGTKPTITMTNSGGYVRMDIFEVNGLTSCTADDEKHNQNTGTTISCGAITNSGVVWAEGYGTGGSLAVTGTNFTQPTYGTGPDGFFLASYDTTAGSQTATYSASSSDWNCNSVALH